MSNLVKLSIVLFFALVQFSFSQSTERQTDIIDYNTVSSVWFSFEPSESYEVLGSRFIINDKLSSKFYPSVPSFLQREGLSKNSFGVKASWDRFSNNFLDIIPQNIPSSKGVPTEFSMWLWGNDTNVEVVAIFTRPDGLSYSAPLGKLNFKGWKKKTVKLPAHIFKEGDPRNPSRNYSFDRFRVFLGYDEPVNDLFFFFDNFVLTESVSHSRYDGYDLERIISQEIEDEQGGQASNGTSGSSSSQANSDSDEESANEDSEETSGN